MLTSMLYALMSHLISLLSVLSCGLIILSNITLSSETDVEISIGFESCLF